MQPIPEANDNQSKFAPLLYLHAIYQKSRCSAWCALNETRRLFVALVTTL